MKDLINLDPLDLVTFIMVSALVIFFVVYDIHKFLS